MGQPRTVKGRYDWVYSKSASSGVSGASDTMRSSKSASAGVSGAREMGSGGAMTGSLSFSNVASAGVSGDKTTVDETPFPAGSSGLPGLAEKRMTALRERTAVIMIVIAFMVLIVDG